MNIDEMVAGRELDALVAEKVMGGKVEHNWDDFDGGDISKCRGCGFFDQDDSRPEFCISNYSTDIAAAWEVVEKALTLPNRVMKLARDVEGRWHFELTSGSEGSFLMRADTAPLVLCRAALKAVL